MLAHIQTWSLAQTLVGAKLRLSITASVTGLSSAMLRKLWRETHGISPTPGKLPESASSFIKTSKDAARLSTFAALHLSHHGKVDSSAEKLIESWRAYQSLMGETLDINAAYYVLRDIRAGLIDVVTCSGCGARYIFDGSFDLTKRCPFCAKNKIK
jgi:hypothetical protein